MFLSREKIKTTSTTPTTTSTIQMIKIRHF